MSRRRSVATLVALVVVLGLVGPARAVDPGPHVVVRGRPIPAARLAAIGRALPAPRDAVRWYRAAETTDAGTVVADLVTYRDRSVRVTGYLAPAGTTRFAELAHATRLATRTGGETCALSCAEGLAAATGASAVFCAAAATLGPIGWLACGIFAADVTYLAQRNCEQCRQVEPDWRVCPILMVMRESGYDEPPLTIDPDGDLYVAGKKVYDCPPYDR